MAIEARKPMFALKLADGAIGAYGARFWYALLHRHRFGEVAGLIDVRALGDRHVVGEELQEHRVYDRGQQVVGRRHVDDMGLLVFLDAVLGIGEHE